VSDIQRYSHGPRPPAPPASKFASVYFSESCLFNGLQPIQIKKIAPPDFADWFCAQSLAPSFLSAGHSGFPRWRVYGRIADQPRICRRQPGRGSRNIELCQWLGVVQADDERLQDSPGCGRCSVRPRRGPAPLGVSARGDARLRGCCPKRANTDILQLRRRDANRQKWRDRLAFAALRAAERQVRRPGG
jgi:hypothetical protein